MKITFGDGCTRSTIDYLFGGLVGWTVGVRIEGPAHEPGVVSRTYHRWETARLVDIVTRDDGDTRLVFARLDDEDPITLTGEKLDVSAWDDGITIHIY